MESISVPVPRASGNTDEPPAVTDGSSPTGNSVEPAPASNLFGNDVTHSVATGNVTVAKPPSAYSEPDHDSVPFSPDTVTVPCLPSLPSNVLARKEVISTPPAPDVGLLTPSLVDDVPMEVDGHAGLAMPMEVDNHVSLDGPPPIQSVVLDTTPVWLQSPLKHLRKEFCGDLEDKVLGSFVALEMAWQPVSCNVFLTVFFQLIYLNLARQTYRHGRPPQGCCMVDKKRTPNRQGPTICRPRILPGRGAKMVVDDPAPMARAGPRRLAPSSADSGGRILAGSPSRRQQRAFPRCTVPILVATGCGGRVRQGRTC